MNNRAKWQAGRDDRIQWVGDFQRICCGILVLGNGWENWSNSPFLGTRYLEQPRPKSDICPSRIKQVINVTAVWRALLPTHMRQRDPTRGIVTRQRVLVFIKMHYEWKQWVAKTCKIKKKKRRNKQSYHTFQFASSWNSMSLMNPPIIIPGKHRQDRKQYNNCLNIFILIKEKKKTKTKKQGYWFDAWNTHARQKNHFKDWLSFAIFWQNLEGQYSWSWSCSCSKW